MKHRAPIAAATLVLALSATARAATLYSPPLTAGDGNVLRCQVANLGTAPRTVTIESYGFCTSSCPGAPGDGLLLDSLPAMTLAPLSTAVLDSFDTSTPSRTPHVCKFTVQGGKARYRATACTVIGGDPTACVPAN